LEYVLGVRERTDTPVRQVVLEDSRAFTPLFLERTGALRANRWQGRSGSEVNTAGRRYIVCRNEVEAAAKDAPIAAPSSPHCSDN
jgi:hypothetical protein